MGIRYWVPAISKASSSRECTGMGSCSDLCAWPSMNGWIEEITRTAEKLGWNSQRRLLVPALHGCLYGEVGEA